jgi:serine/threonine-protein phosphatase 2A activator
LGGFSAESDLDQGGFGTRERELVLGVIEPYVIWLVNWTNFTLESLLIVTRYLELIRKLILTYSLEPAGSHGVWGLDDHFFIPYIFGSAQLSPPIISPAEIPQEGSIPDAPRPGDVTKQSIVTRERKSNMYFSAIGFIYDVKKGPFWEHSPMLFDISGVTAGWAKINKVCLLH